MSKKGKTQKPTVKVTTTFRRSSVVELTREQLLEALELTVPGLVLRDVSTLRVYVRVPGGGDWSNTNLEVDTDSPLFVAWDSEHVREEESLPIGGAL